MENQFFGLKFPIIQAPMAGVSTPEMAAAVSNAGGLGSIAIGSVSAVNAVAMIEKTRSLTDKPFNVNVFCHSPPVRDLERERNWIEFLRPIFAEFDVSPPAELKEIYKSFLEDTDLLKMIVQQRPDFVSFHFGIPSAETVSALRAVGIKTLATATNSNEAKLIEDAGIDAIIAQGFEAGGHRGNFDPEAEDQQFTTCALVDLLVAQSRLPVIAAGGIRDGREMKLAFEQGASAVQLGTAFILCPESSASSAYRHALQSASKESTRMTTAISGRAARGIINRLTLLGEKETAPRPPDYPLAYDLSKILNDHASKKGSHDFAAFWAGEGAPLVSSVSASELIVRLVKETLEA